MLMELTTIDFEEPFGSIDAKSTGNGLLTLLCFSNKSTYEVRFDSFLGIENREEFFDASNGARYTFGKHSLSNWNPPISFCTLPEFQESLSTYESTLVSEKTKLWVFLSQSNCVEVFSNGVPIIRKWSNIENHQKRKDRNMVCFICGGDSDDEHMIELSYSSKSDGSSQALYVHPMCLSSSSVTEMLFHPDITENMEEIRI